MNNIERNDLLTALYKTTELSELLKQFDSYLTVNAKGTKDKQKIILLQQILFYSHAIIYNQKVQTATKWRGHFITTAKENRKLKLSSKEINEAFSFFNNTTRAKIARNAILKPKIKTVEDEIEELKKKLEKKPNDKDIIEEIKVLEDSKCQAKKSIRTLQAQLDNKTYELAKGQKEEDKQAFIKIALVALSTGARLKDIMEDLTVSTKKGVIYFNDGVSSKEGVILELDAKTVQGYLKAIRSHFEKKAVETIARYNEVYSEAKELTDEKLFKRFTHQKRKNDREKIINHLHDLSKMNQSDIDISTGIRKAVKRLNIPNCQNTNHLNTLYRECLTSSAQK